MDDNKKNEYTEQDAELTLDDLSDVSGGFRRYETLTEHYNTDSLKELIEKTQQGEYLKGCVVDENAIN